MRYAIWNNKGGVGKSFVTFITACEYAHQNRDKIIVIVDMCPQANISEVVLGGNGKGAAELQKILSEKHRRTIGGYFDERISSPHKITKTEINYLLNANKFNKNLDDNIFLIAGDPSLEIQAEAINQIAGQTLPANSWSNVHQWLKDLLDEISKKETRDIVFFIDCNPSFAAYTELAIIASERLIVPCSADGSSARAISNLGQLIYGIGVPAAYAAVSFHKRAESASLKLPTIHTIPLNRSTQYEQKASKAFEAMYGEIRKRAQLLFRANRSIFSQTKAVFLDIPDAHSVSVVTSHLGIPLHKIKLSKYRIHSKDTQVPKDSLKRYTTAFSNLVSTL